jgi:hypothetical protein
MPRKTRTVIKIEDPAARLKWLEDCRDKYEEAKQGLIDAAEEHGARALDIDDIEVNEYDNLGLFEHAAVLLALAEEGLTYQWTETEDDDRIDLDPAFLDLTKLALRSKRKRTAVV